MMMQVKKIDRNYYFLPDNSTRSAQTADHFSTMGSCKNYLDDCFKVLSICKRQILHMKFVLFTSISFEK